ncbi:hypothetical protein FQR65_LT06047 [Abscondita terminalis]|nr:hypothetical protein FQR65_LT06047 [Abscondita terminalis]
MTSEEYVILNPRETEVPSSISFIQNHYENLKKRLTLVGVSISLCSFLLLHVGQLVTSITLLQNCVVDKYTPAYFIVAGVTGIIPKVYHFVTANENNNLESKKCIPILMLYVFELAWLITGKPLDIVHIFQIKVNMILRYVLLRISNSSQWLFEGSVCSSKLVNIIPLCVSYFMLNNFHVVVKHNFYVSVF